MDQFSHELESSVIINAEPADVFNFFTDSTRWASWWGTGSTIDGRPGGAFLIRYPNGIEAGGDVVSLTPPNRIELTFGYASGKPIATGDSRVAIVLEPVSQGTRVLLTHAFAEPGVRDQHVQGWRYQLALFSNAVADAVYANATSIADSWFAAWAETDATARGAALSGISVTGIQFRDRFANITGLESLSTHIGATHFYMPGAKLERSGAVRQCQGTVLVDWIMRGADGTEMARGANVMVFALSGKLAAVTGLTA